MDEIKTKRLFLRVPQMDDAQAAYKFLNDLEISRWLSKIPHPYSVAEAMDFIGKILSGEIGKPGEVRFIFDHDGLCGCVGVENGLGYWIAKPTWGRGYATEAAHALLTWYFEQNPRQGIKSGHFIGNDASARVLTKLGFSYTGKIEEWTCAATKTKVELEGMSLSVTEFKQNTTNDCHP